MPFSVTGALNETLRVALDEAAGALPTDAPDVLWVLNCPQTSQFKQRIGFTTRLLAVLEEARP